MRPSSLPRLIVAQIPDQAIGEMSDSPYSTFSMHSRDSSGASDNYSPLTQTFSFYEHKRHSNSSSSSLATTPPRCDTSIDSLHRTSRAALDDLVEDPHEREDTFDFCDITPNSANCHCRLDTTDACYPSDPDLAPRQCYSTPALERPSLDYSLADGFHDMNSDNEAPLRIQKRRISVDPTATTLASRIGNRLPSLRRREKALSSPTAPRRCSIKSAPTSRVPSRASSFRISSLTKVPDNTDGTEDKTPRSQTPISSVTEREQTLVHAKSIEIGVPHSEEPIDRKALASTPLLPMPFDSPQQSDEDSVRSPLQSPTVAAQDLHRSYISSPASSPTFSAEASSPALSSQVSIASLGTARSGQVISPTDASSMAIDIPQDKWAKKLGHANFSVLPEPYMPGRCDVSACKRLLEDWESARRQFMNQAARTSEHYGPTSQVYKFTEQKWAEIDAQWKQNHELVVSKAEANGESPIYQTLAEPAPLTKLPSLNDPHNSGKFPSLEDSDIVGPMVQYAKITQKPSKKATFLKFFNDIRFPGNTLGRSPAGFGR